MRSWVGAIVACVLALLILAGGGWAVWIDRANRDPAGFVSIGTTELRTDTYALVGDLHGSGPDWLYGSTVMGDIRARATSRWDRPLFVGIARASDVANYLDGTGYATIDHIENGAITPHSGGPPSAPPAHSLSWVTSTQGTGEQTIVWKARPSDLRVVIMNADASAGVAVNGDVAARFPWLPWVAVGLLIAGAALGVLGAWLVVRVIRRPVSPQSTETIAVS